MATVNKKYIIDKLHQRLGLSKRVLKDLINALLEEIKRSIEIGEEVKIVRFGSFIPYKTKKRLGRNFKTSEKLEIESFKKIVFHPAPHFKAKLDNEDK